MLMGCEGSSIGVLASGPKRLRHDVAAICSSGLANNLHFDSIALAGELKKSYHGFKQATLGKC